jgi:outer membrane protein assembly factor BamB
VTDQVNYQDATKRVSNFIRRAPLILLALTVVACGRSGTNKLTMGEGGPAPWRYVRGGVDAQGAANGSFNGSLDVIWERGLKEKPQGPLALANGAIVVAGAKRKVFLINPETGETFTKFKNRSSPQSGGLLIDSLLYNSTSPPFNYLDCRAVSNGKLRWRSVILDISAPLLNKGERLFALGGDGVIYCFNRFSGDLLWEKGVGGKMISAPALEARAAGDVLWITNSNGWIGAYDAASGKELYRRVMNESLVSTAAVAPDGTIYFSGQGGQAFALSRKTDDAPTADFLSELVSPAEPLEDEFPADSFMLAKSTLRSPSWSSPAVKDGFVVFVDNSGNVYAYDSPRLTNTIWQAKLGGALVASPIIVGDFVVVGLLNGYLYVLRLKTGEIVSSRLLESPIKFSAISDGQRVYVATQRKSLYCFGSLASAP